MYKLLLVRWETTLPLELKQCYLRALTPQHDFPAVTDSDRPPVAIRQKTSGTMITYGPITAAGVAAPEMPSRARQTFLQSLKGKAMFWRRSSLERLLPAPANAPHLTRGGPQPFI